MLSSHPDSYKDFLAALQSRLTVKMRLITAEKDTFHVLHLHLRKQQQQRFLTFAGSLSLSLNLFSYILNLRFLNAGYVYMS